MMDPQADRAPDQVHRPTANRPLSRNGVEMPNRICITLVFFLLVVVPALWLELLATVTGDDTLRQFFLAPMRLMAKLKVLEMAISIYATVKALKEADDVIKWLVDRALPLFRAAAQRFTNAF